MLAHKDVDLVSAYKSHLVYYSVGTDKMYRYDMTKKTTKKYSLYSTWITAAQKAKLS